MPPTHVYELRRRIAREWLIFLMCILIGLSAIYCASYFPIRFEGISPDGVAVYRRQNPGEMFIDLSHGWGHYYRLNGDDASGSRLWLYALSPYFILCFVRSIIWS